MHHLQFWYSAIQLCIYVSGIAVGVIGTPLITAGQSQESLTAYGTFNNIGVTLNIKNTEDPNRNASATIEYRAKESAYRSGFPLTRVSQTRFVGSLFWLEPGTTYEVRVTVKDPDQGPLDGQQFTTSVTTRPELHVPAPKREIIVSPTGDGSSCSRQSPCNLDVGLNRAGPGDAVILLKGVYYTGDITVPNGGSAAAPLIIRGEKGAILDGADPMKFIWEADGDTYRTKINVADTSLVTADGARLYPYNTLGDLRRLEWGVPGFYINGDLLYVRLAADANPNEKNISISRYNTAIQVLNKNYIYFDNLTFRHYGQGSWAKTLYLKNSSYNLIQNSVFQSTQQGVAIQGDANGNVIQQNEFSDTIFQWPWESVKDGTELERGGLRIQNQSTGQGTVIRYNSFHDMFDGFGVCPSQPFDGTNETDVHDNIIYRMIDDAIETDGWCVNVRIWNNTIYNVLSGISLAPAVGGPTYVLRNVIYRIGVNEESNHTGGSFKFNSNGDASGAIYLLHNTVDARTSISTGGLDIKKSGAWSLIYSRNNIWAGRNFAIRNANPDQPIDLDYDALWSLEKDKLVQWSTDSYTELKGFTQSTGQEEHGYIAEPQFVDSLVGDYSLVKASPLLDKGIPIPGINDSYSGNGPDLGAYESGVSVPHRPLSHKVFLPSVTN